MAITFKKRYKDEMTGEWGCPVCEVKLESQHAFTVHIRQHNPTDHSHTCSICAKQLSSASSLDRHMLIHSGERPFGCSICGMKFTTNGNMHRHMRTHGQEQQAAIGYISSKTLDQDGLRVRNKKKRKTKSLPNSNSPTNTNAQSQNSSFGFDDLSIKESFLALLQLQNQRNGFEGDFNFDSSDNQSAAAAAAASFYSQLPKSLNQFDQLNLSGSVKHLQQQLNNRKDSKLMLNDDLDDSEHRSTTSSDEQQENLLNKNGIYHDDEINKLAFKRSLAQNSTLYNTLLNNSLTAAITNGNNTNGLAANNKSDLADINSILSVISSVTPMLANVTSDLQHLPLNDEQMAKINQTLHQQTLQEQNTLLNSATTSTTPGKQNGKRSRNNQLNGSARNLSNGTSLNSGKRMKKESKVVTNDFSELSSLANLNNLNSLSNLSNLNNLTNSLNNLKTNSISNSINNSLNSINNLMNGQAEDDRKSDEGSDKSEVKNGSDIENEMINGKLNNSGKSLSTDKRSSKQTTNNNSSTTSQSQSLLNTSQQTLEHDDTLEDEEDEVNLSEEEEANKLEQELCEQIKKEEKKSSEMDEDDCKSDRTLEIDEDKKNDQQNNDLSSLVDTKKQSSGISENLADLLIKSDKNNNKNMRNNNGNSSFDLNQRLFIDPMVEEDVKLLERQLQDQQYLCKICHLEVRSVNTLRRHQRLHDAGGQLYACHYCTYTSLDKSSLIRHLRTHNGERPYQCTICKYAFTTKANCERHVRKRHKKQNKSEIRVSMQYKNLGSNNSTDGLISSLNNSLQTSNNQSDQLIASTATLDNIPPSSLVETNKSILASSNMHLIPHVFYEPNSIETRCRYCSVDFRFNRLLRQHLRTMCNNNFTKKPFNCILCNQGFTTKNVCVRHFEKAHKDVPHDQIQNMILEIPIDNIDGQNLTNRFSNGLNASALAALSSTTGSGSSELMSNGDSSELDQPLNLVNGFYNGNLNSKVNLNNKYMDEDEEFDDEDNQNALDLSVKTNERQAIDQLSSMSRSLDLSGLGALNNQLNEPSPDVIRNAINTLLALSFMPNNKSIENSQQTVQTNNLLGSSSTLNSNLNNMNNLLAAQQMQNNSTSNSLLNLFNSFM